MRTIGLVCSLALSCRKYNVDPAELTAYRLTRAAQHARAHAARLLVAHGWTKVDVAMALGLSAHYVGELCSERRAS